MFWDVYDVYNVCFDYGEDLIKCIVVVGLVFVFSLVMEGDELVGVFRYGDEFVEVFGKLYSMLKCFDFVEEVGDGVVRVKERFVYIFDDIVKYGDDVVKVFDDFVRVGVLKEVVEEIVKYGVMIKEKRKELNGWRGY